MDRNGERELLLDAPHRFNGARLSRDGRFLALQNFGANGSLWVYDLERGTLGLVAGEFDNIMPVWIPDGTRLTFTSNRTRVFNLYSQAADGNSEAQPVTESDHHRGALS